MVPLLVVSATARAWLQDDRGELVLPLDAAVPNLVAPGNYWLWAAGSTMAPQLHPVQIGAGESLFRELRADDGVPCAFEFPFASIDNVVDLNVELHVKILDHRGELVLRDDIRLEEHELFRWQQALRPGSYRLVCSTDWGGHAEKALEVTAKMPVLAMTIPLRTSHR